MDEFQTAGKATVLVVDDAPGILSLMACLLEGEYNVAVAAGGEKALQIAASNSPPDLILLDILMPGLDGYEVCRRLKGGPGTANIPVIFFSGMAGMENETKGLELGAVDYITKPISPPIVMARIKNHLALSAMHNFLRDKNGFLELEVAKRTREVTAIQDATILALASLAETRDSETGQHIRRTQFFVKALAEKLRSHPRFSGFLTDANINTLFKSAPLHDIGKVGIPDRVLLKPGRLNRLEFALMKTHSTLGHDAIQRAQTTLGADAGFLSCAKSIAYSHHEKWDGSGYPQGLAGDEIPIVARLMAVADVYDALISRRVYKLGMSHERAVEIMVEHRGTHFDAEMIDAFVEIQEEFRAIAQRFADADEGSDGAPSDSSSSA